MVVVIGNHLILLKYMCWPPEYHTRIHSKKCAYKHTSTHSHTIYDRQTGYIISHTQWDAHIHSCNIIEKKIITNRLVFVRSRSVCQKYYKADFQYSLEEKKLCVVQFRV